MGWEGWVSVAEGAGGAVLLGWAVRPGGAWRRAGDTSSRLVASASEMRQAEATSVETWAASTEREAFSLRAGRVNTAAFGGVLVLACGVTVASRFAGARVYGVEIAVVGLLVLLACCVPIASARVAYQERQKAVAASRVDDAIGQLAGPGNLTLGNLFTLNRRQLDQYQEQTRRQQRSAFRLTQVASVVAFGALIAGVVVTFAAPSTTDKLLSGGLAALGSALSAFLASTFYKAHKSANEQLNRYYLEPQRTGRLLAAERLATFDPAMDPTTLSTILTAILSWEMPSGGRRKSAAAPAPLASPLAPPAPPPSVPTPNGATAHPG